MWYVYLLRCADGTLYCGVTTDMARRLDEHNGLKPGGAKYTRTRRPVRVDIYVAQPDRAAACRLEFRVQRTRREKKRAFLASFGSTDALC